VSTPDNMVPFPLAPGIKLTVETLPTCALPGLRDDAIQGLAASYPGALTGEMRSLLRITCGYTAGEFGTIDFTSRWHPPEPLAVFRPCLTLALDDDGRRWIAETSRHTGLPGPIWCLLSAPEVALYISDDLAGLLARLNHCSRQGGTSKWLRSLHKAAKDVWAHREILAEQSQESCRRDRELRSWLAALPFDAHVYDLRIPSGIRGWPYGFAGPDGRLYRCGRLPVFAVAACPTASRWVRHLAEIAATEQMPRPAATRSLARSSLSAGAFRGPGLPRDGATPPPLQGTGGHPRRLSI
jgi:hypothetical protein